MSQSIPISKTKIIIPNRRSTSLGTRGLRENITDDRPGTSGGYAGLLVVA